MQKQSRLSIKYYSEKSCQKSRRGFFKFIFWVEMEFYMKTVIFCLYIVSQHIFFNFCSRVHGKKYLFQIKNDYVYTSNWKLIFQNLLKNYDLLSIFFLPGSFWTISAAYFSARLALIPAARALLAIAPSNESSIHTN